MIRFIKRHFKYAYVEGTEVDLSAKAETELVKNGYAEKVTAKPVRKSTKRTSKKVEKR